MNQLHMRISNRWISTNLELDVRMEVIVQILMHPKVHANRLPMLIKRLTLTSAM